MLKNWLKIYIYHFKNNKLFTSLNILGLSIGIAGLIFSILYWNDEHSYNAWNPEKENVFQVISEPGNTPGNDGGCDMPAILGQKLKGNSTKIESFCYLWRDYDSEILSYKSKKTQINKIISAQSTFFSFFPFTIIKGSVQKFKQDPEGLALSESASKRLFGNINPIGKSFLFFGRQCTIQVIYQVPGNSSINPELIHKLVEENIKVEGDHWDRFGFTLLLKLKNPKDKRNVESVIEKIFFDGLITNEAKNHGITPSQYTKKFGKPNISLEQLKTERLNSKKYGLMEGKGNATFLYILMGVSLLILLLSIVNYINLTTANSIKRAKEIGVRKILGASKRNIISQFIFETVLTTILALIIALSIVEITLPSYNQLLEKELLLISSQFYKQLIFIFLITVLVAGVLPGIYVANFKSQDGLKGSFITSKSGIYLRNGMLILQFTVASFFMIGSLIVYNQVKYMSTKDLGFKGEQILEFDSSTYIDENIYERYLTLKSELLKIKGIEQVSSGSFKLGLGTTSASDLIYNNTKIIERNMIVDYGMLEMLQIKLKSGRFFNKSIASDAKETVLINETICHLMNEKNPIGKMIEWGGKRLRIIGVVKDFHFYGFDSEIPPMIFFHYKTFDDMKYALEKISAKVSPKNLELTLKKIENIWNKKMNKDYPFEPVFVDKEFEKTYKEYVNQRNLFAILNIVAILIALFGLFALASFSIESRMKEIAIRKVLGANTKLLLISLSKQYIIFFTIGYSLAVLPVYYLLEIWLQNFVFRIDISPIPFIVGLITLLSLTLIVILTKAYRATKVNALKYLKYE